MMPPKKSKAARAGKKEPEEEENELQEDVNGTSEKEAAGDVLEREESEEEENRNDEAILLPEEDAPKKEAVNIFEETVVEGKRKRNIPPAELKLSQWINTHFEEKPDVHYKMSDIYEAYVEECIADEVGGVEEGILRRMIKDKFPGGFSLKDDSKYKSEIKQRKKINRPKVQGDTFKLKPKEVLERTFKDLGNPRSGIRFNTIRQYIAGKYPALRVDIKPNYVKNALNMGERYGYIQLLRGIGKSGFYRLYVENEPSEDEEEEKEKNEADVKEEDKSDEDDKKKEGEDEENGDEKAEGEEAKEGEEDSKEDKKDDGKAEKKKQKRKAVPQSRQGLIVHSQPKRIEDTFPLAITFGTEPKVCSVRKISAYIADHYPEVNVDTRLRQCLEKGAEKGFWEHVSGAVLTGSYQLTIDEFDPTDDDDMIGKVVNAIMACTEPKQCSAGLLKNYVMEFHPAFKVAEQPHRFKKALERAEGCGDLIRLSGIGSSGSFQLAYSFAPSPTVLAAQDTPSDYEEDSEDEESLPEVEDTGKVDLTYFQDAYVPRPTKRRGRQREATKSSFAERSAIFQEKAHSTQLLKRGPGSSSASSSAAASPAKGRKMKKAAAKKGKGRTPQRARSTPATDSEDSEEEQAETSDSEPESDYNPKRGHRAKASKRKSVEERDEVKYAEKYKPRPSTSRGGRGQARSPPPPAPAKSPAKGKKAAKKAKPAPKTKATPTKASLKAKPAQLRDMDDEEEEEEEPATPRKRGRAAPATPASAGRSKRAAALAAAAAAKEDSEDDDDGDYGRTPAKKGRTSRGAARKTSYKEEDDFEDEDMEEATPPAKKGPTKRGRSSISPATPGRSKRAAVLAATAVKGESEDEDDDLGPTPTKRGRSPRGGTRKTSYKEEDEDEEDEATPPAKKGKKKGAKGKSRRR